MKEVFDVISTRETVKPATRHPERSGANSRATLAAL